MANLSYAWADHIYNLLNLGTAPPDLSGGVFLRLFTASPGGGGSFTNEVAGGSYTGQDITGAMGAPTNGAGTSTGAVTFTDMPSVTVGYWAKCKSAAGTIDADEMIEYGSLVAPITVLAGQPFVINIGDLDASAT